MATLLDNLPKRIKLRSQFIGLLNSQDDNEDQIRP